MWENRTDKERQEIGNKISEGLKGKQNRLGQTNTEEHNKKISETLKNSDKLKEANGQKVSIMGTVYRTIKESLPYVGVSYPTICRRLDSSKHPDWIRL